MSREVIMDLCTYLLTLILKAKDALPNKKNWLFAGVARAAPTTYTQTLSHTRAHTLLILHFVPLPQLAVAVYVAASVAAAVACPSMYLKCALTLAQNERAAYVYVLPLICVYMYMCISCFLYLF